MSEEWKSDGDCSKCRRKSYCGTSCKANEQWKQRHWSETVAAVIDYAVGRAISHSYVCDKCKKCENYMITEEGCKGSSTPCEQLLYNPSIGQACDEKPNYYGEY